MAYKFVDEILDLVNENDEVIGKIKRSDAYAKRLKNFRGINAFIINDKGQIWIPRRVKEKRFFPLCLDTSVGGHVISGETYEEAIVREVKEELNLDLNKLSYRELGYLTPYKDGTSDFQKVFEIHYNQSPLFNKNDYITSYWLFPSEIEARINAGDPAKTDLLLLIRIFYL